jgi:hypothetical protein
MKEYEKGKIESLMKYFYSGCYQKDAEIETVIRDFN